MYCSECGQNNKEEAKFCCKCGKQLLEKNNDVKVTSTDNKESNVEINHKISSPKKKSFLSIVLIIIFIFIALGAVGNYFDSVEQEDANKEATKIFDDAMRGTNTALTENSEYVDLIKKSLDYYKFEANKMFEACLSFDENEFLELSSFEPQSKLKSYIADIKNCISEVDNFEIIYDNYKKNSIEYVNNLFNNSNIYSEYKKSGLDALKKSINDEKQKQLTIERMRALNNHMVVVLDIYELLDSNYYNYEIGIDEYGDDTIYFDNDYVLNRYNELAEKSQITSSAYLKAENDVLNYANKKFDNLGIDIDVNEIVDYMIE